MPDLLTIPPDSSRPWYRWINWLALDAVAVAISWQLVFAKMTGARLSVLESVALGTVVWLIYLTDRLLDASPTTGRRERHAYARRHARWLVPLMVLLAVAVTWLALHELRWITVRTALFVGMGVGAYFLVLLAARWQTISQLLLTGISGLIMMGLVQGDALSAAGFQLWRAVVAGTLATVLYVGLRHQYDPPPWSLTKKVLGGYLFAVGVAVAPFSHVQDWEGLLHGTPVMLFASACALNSLGIRLWENEASAEPEQAMLQRLYPWLLTAIGLGAAVEAWGAGEWSRPVLGGVAFCVAGFTFLHWGRHRWTLGWRTLAADGLMVAVALVVRFYLMAGLP